MLNNILSFSNVRAWLNIICSSVDVFSSKRCLIVFEASLDVNESRIHSARQVTASTFLKLQSLLNILSDCKNSSNVSFGCCFLVANRCLANISLAGFTWIFFDWLISHTTKSVTDLRCKNCYDWDLGINMILNLFITLSVLHLKTQIRIYIIYMNTTVFNNTIVYYHTK